MIVVDALEEPGLKHAFYTRRGGVSSGIYRSLNCGLGSGDQADAVRANRARTMAALDLPADALHTCLQHHSADVITIEAGTDPEDRKKGDALVTSVKGLALGVSTADCAPVLFADTNDNVVGAAHAGWRGALGGVLEATVDAMIDLGARADNIRAAVGPCIGVESYEVGPEFPGPFIERDRSAAQFFEAAQTEGKFLFNLSGYVVERLMALGLGDVVRLDCDTCKDEVTFFSYRRSRHRNEPDYGRSISVIALSE